MNRSAVGVLLAGMTVLAACSANSSDDTGSKLISRADTSSTTSSTTTTTTTAPPSNVYRVGDRVKTSMGNEEQIYSYSQPAQHNQYTNPEAGKEFAAADIEACIKADLSTDANGNQVAPDQRYIPVNPYDYELVMPDNSRIQPSYGGPEPALNATNLAQGECVRGWVTWQVPAGQRPAAIVDTKTGPPNLRWTV